MVNRFRINIVVKKQEFVVFTIKITYNEVENVKYKQIKNACINKKITTNYVLISL